MPEAGKNASRFLVEEKDTSRRHRYSQGGGRAQYHPEPSPTPPQPSFSSQQHQGSSDQYPRSHYQGSDRASARSVPSEIVVRRGDTSSDEEDLRISAHESATPQGRRHRVHKNPPRNPPARIHPSSEYARQGRRGTSRSSRHALSPSTRDLHQPSARQDRKPHADPRHILRQNVPSPPPSTLVVPVHMQCSPASSTPIYLYEGRDVRGPYRQDAPPVRRGLLAGANHVELHVLPTPILDEEGELWFAVVQVDASSGFVSYAWVHVVPPEVECLGAAHVQKFQA